MLLLPCVARCSPFNIAPDFPRRIGVRSAVSLNLTAVVERPSNDMSAGAGIVLDEERQPFCPYRSCDHPERAGVPSASFLSRADCVHEFFSRLKRRNTAERGFGDVGERFLGKERLVSGDNHVGQGE